MVGGFGLRVLNWNQITQGGSVCLTDPPTADLVFHGQRSALGENRSVGKDWVCMEEKNKGADLFNE